MSRFPVTVPRTNRLIPVSDKDAVNVLCIGDTHMDEPGYPWATRNAVAAADIGRMIGNPQLDAAIQLGDHTTKATTAEFDAYKVWKGTVSLPAGIPFREVPGNHDLIGNNASGTPDLVTPAQWAGIFGQPAKDAVIDIGDRVRLLLTAPAANATTGQANVRRLTIDTATVQWLDARMDETTRQCVVFFHAPLENTVGPLDGSAFSSYDERWRAHYDSTYPLNSMIARHTNMVAWVSGHTHSRVTEVDLVKAMQVGNTKFAAVSASSPAFWNPSGGATVDPVVTCVLTVLPDRLEVRYRDHGNTQWLAPVRTVSLW